MGALGGWQSDISYFGDLGDTPISQSWRCCLPPTRLSLDWYHGTSKRSHGTFWRYHFFLFFFFKHNMKVNTRVKTRQNIELKKEWVEEKSCMSVLQQLTVFPPQNLWFTFSITLLQQEHLLICSY